MYGGVHVGFAKIEDVASAFLAAATDPDMKTSGSAYTIPDSRCVVCVSAPARPAVYASSAFPVLSASSVSAGVSFVFSLLTCSPRGSEG